MSVDLPVSSKVKKPRKHMMRGGWAVIGIRAGLLMIPLMNVFGCNVLIHQR